MFNKHIRKVKDLTIVGGLTILAITTLTGCGDSSQNNIQQNNEINQQKNVTTVIKEVSENKYKIIDEFPSNETRVMLRDKEGNERVLTKDELDKIIKDEAVKIDNGTSNLTSESSISNGGMGLGEVVLASAAGMILGAWIGSKLFNNNNYNSKRESSYKNSSTFNRSNNLNKNTTSSKSKNTKSGFFSKAKNKVKSIAKSKIRSKVRSSFGG